MRTPGHRRAEAGLCEDTQQSQPEFIGKRSQEPAMLTPRLKNQDKSYCGHLVHGALSMKGKHVSAERSQPCWLLLVCYQRWLFSGQTLIPQCGGVAANEDLTLPLPESPHHNALIMKPSHFYCVPRRLSQVPWILILGNHSLSTSLAFPRVASL